MNGLTSLQARPQQCKMRLWDALLEAHLRSVSRLCIPHKLLDMQAEKSTHRLNTHHHFSCSSSCTIIAVARSLPSSSTQEQREEAGAREPSKSLLITCLTKSMAPGQDTASPEHRELEVAKARGTLIWLSSNLFHPRWSSIVWRDPDLAEGGAG